MSTFDDLAGSGTLGSFAPENLWGNDAPRLTDHALVKAGQVLAKYTVVAKDASDRLVPHDPTKARVTVTGGATGQTAEAPETKPVGFLAQPIDTSGTGTNADTDCPFFYGGNVDDRALIWHASLTTLALRRAALGALKTLAIIRRL